LEIVDKFILSAIYASSFTGNNPIDAVKGKTHLTDQYINDRIENLIKNGLIETDKKKLD